MELNKFPLIKYVLSQFPDNILENSILFGCQHLLPSVELLINALFEKGLQPKNTALIGKCYTSSSLTIKSLEEKGVFVDPLSREFDSHQSYNNDLRSYLENFLVTKTEKNNLSKYGKVIILDDGGDLHLIAQKKINVPSKIVGVEQTSRGIYQLAKTKLAYPVLNVARSKIKLIHESPMVAEAIMNGLTKSLAQIGFRPKHALIVGKGNIGGALIPLMKDFCKVTVFDIASWKSDLSENHLKKVGNEIDLIIGCTGQNIYPLIKRCNLLKKGLVLASASSSDIEFDAAQFRSQCKRTNICHETLEANGIYLLNCGFPINFYGGDKDQVSLKKFQLTSALLLAGILQAVDQKKCSNKLIDLDENLQFSIFQKFNENPSPSSIELNKELINKGLSYEDERLPV